MALRATSDLQPSTRSAKPGDVVVFRAKVENGGGGAQVLMLAVEGAPVPFVFDPPSWEVPAKSRRTVEFRWTAILPEGERAKTLRGKLVLRTLDGKLLASAPLDVYVAQA